jgi:hypothetical protein
MHTLSAYSNANNLMPGKFAGLVFESGDVATPKSTENGLAASWYASRWGATAVRDSTFFGKPWDPTQTNVDNPLTPDHLGALNLVGTTSAEMSAASLLEV